MINKPSERAVMDKKTVREDIARQKALGHIADCPLLLAALDCCEQYSEWKALAKATWHTYGPSSYEAHRVWKPSEMLLNLQKSLLSK